ncbi:MAG: 1-acyl-sn-glycerol-3-phosphate acyltransferase [Thermodesulfobacteriota bacterium]|nr:1-acyl-sn-glycerol-3-phosphate acyltransferase [Thermodesulfobacteriota bacterium]
MKGSQNEYAYLLEGRYGILLRQVVGSLFSHINIPEAYKDSVSSLSSKGHIVYAHRAKSKIDALLLNYRLGREGLPIPRLVFGEKFLLYQPISKWKEILTGVFRRYVSPFESGFYIEYMKQAGGASLAYLNGEADYYPILELLKVQRQVDIPIYIIPQRVVYNKTPIVVKDASKADGAQLMGLKKLSVLFKGREQGFIEHGEPINILHVLKKGGRETKFIEETAREIRNELQQRIANLGSNVSEAPIKKRGFLIQKTIKDPILQSFLRAYAIQKETTTESLEKKGHKILDQIASDLKPSYINMFSKALTWIFNDIYDGIDIDKEGLKNIREAARKGSLVYVPCHKSHIDYLVLSYCLFHNWMSVPLIAAGINLSFFPMGHILRRGGAFFMRRTFKGDTLYSEIFNAYIRTLLGERISLEFFIEGTRSRSGKLMLPKKGLLSMIVQGWESGVARDVSFVPAYVGYDNVVEEGSYIKEMKGAPKEKENIWQLIKAGSVLKRRYGKVYVRYAKPISLNEYMKDKPLYSKMGQEEKKALYDSLARAIIESIYRQTVVTPFAILCSVLISQIAAMEEDSVRKTFHLYADYLRFLGYHMASSLDDADKAFDDAFNLIKERRLITVDEGETPGNPNLITVKDDDRITLEYYKNSILNCFVPASLIANVGLKYPHGIDKTRLFEETHILNLLLEKEFILDIEGFNKALEFMINRGLISDSQGILYIPRDKRKYLVMFAGLIENYLESYLVVARNISKVGAKKDILRAINKYGTRMHKKGEIKRVEALCLPNYKGAINTFKAKGFIDDDNSIIDTTGLDNAVKEIEAYLED